MSAALYDDGCLTAPRTDHIGHVTASLEESGWLREARLGLDAAEGAVAEAIGVESALTMALDRATRLTALLGGIAREYDSTEPRPLSPEPE